MHDMKKIRAGIIGSGFAARFHFEAMQRVYCTRVEVIGKVLPILKTTGLFFLIVNLIELLINDALF
jgi:hypothetical protein